MSDLDISVYHPNAPHDCRLGSHKIYKKYTLKVGSPAAYAGIYKVKYILYAALKTA